MKLLSTLNKKFDFELLIDPTLNYNDFQIGVIREFIRMTIDELNITSFVKIGLTADREGNGIKTTAFYRNTDKLVMVDAKDRMLGDVMRSVAHELVHHLQYFEKRVPNNVPDIGGQIEDEANALAGVLIKLFLKNHPHGKYLFE